MQEICQCEWQVLRRLDEEITDFVASLDLQDPLDPREAFFWISTNAIWLYRQVNPTQGKQMRYYDHTSLYPWVNKYGEYPVKYPIFVYEPETTDLLSYFGLAKCTVLPTAGLYNPLLPYWCSDKLTFSLSRHLM